MFVSKWHMHRMGLIDFWFYINEEFHFKDGHMLLRGSNGSGKSVTMQSFIPLLLDGNKSSERLDSFGTRSRKIENYLIEEDGDRDDRIGYLYLEFKREDADVYKTIGIGLHARRNKPVDAWYFVIEDNQRINKEIQLMDHNLAISKQVLKNRIGSQVIENQKEYMDRVNAALFGFPSRDDYREAISLLLQLRSPKLSNSLKPTIINEILSSSLQPLSEDDLRPMSEAISNMDEIKDQLDALKQSYISAKAISNIYDQYNHVVLDHKANSYLQKEQVFVGVQKQIQSMKLAIEVDSQKQKDAKVKLQQLRLERSVLEEEKNDVAKQDVLQLVDDVARHKEELASAIITLATKEKQKEEKDNQRIDVKNQLQKQNDKKANAEAVIKESFEELDGLQENLDFEEHQALRTEILTNIEQRYNYAYSESRIKEEITFLQEGLNIYQTIHNIERQQQRFINDRESFEMRKENIEKTLQDYQKLFSELQDEYKENFSVWNKQNEMMKLHDEHILLIFDFISRFESEDSYGEIDALMHSLYFKQYQQLSTQQSTLESDFKQTSSKILEITKEIEEWKNMLEPTPVMDDFMLQNRKLLTNHHMNFLPLYKLLDYADDVAREDQNHFEEMLSRCGLLNALIVEHTNKETILHMEEGCADFYLFTDQKIQDLEIVKIHSEMAKTHDISSLLSTLHLQSNGIKGFQNYFENNVVTGTISKNVESSFIGEASRERYRAFKLSQLQDAAQVLQDEKNGIEKQLEHVQQTMKTLEKEYQSYPSKDDLSLAKQNVEQGEKELALWMKRIQEINVEIGKLNQEITAEKQKISKIAQRLGISTTQEIFIHRKEDFESYAQYLSQIKEEHNAFVSYHEISVILKAQMEDLLSDVDILCMEYNDCQHQIEKLNLRITQKEKQMESLGYESIKRRLEEIQERLLALPNEISTEDQKVGKLISNITNLQIELEHLNTILLQRQEEKQRAFEYYLNEAKLQYVIHDEVSIDEVEHVHRHIQKAYPNLKRKDTLVNDLQTSFYVHRGVLQDYNLSMITVFEESEDTSRLDINARYQGHKISFFALLENLKNDIEKQSALLEDSDRALIEDILVNTISKKIRSHIQSSKRWVDVMNRYMDAMNTSSGLKLNLQWKSHKAENDVELNSEKLVELLEKDVRILKEVDRKKLSSHFRSKIATARKLSEQQDAHESFHQVMKNVMDYRTWFDFRILSQKTGEKKKELTNNAFYAFSGGEKAMAMYIPLFSATAAKFEGAREDAPLLIALDEAFAGVDEKNINNMFDLIGKFKFDYIINSQVLWGDYPSVKGLAIHELFRPENARYVTVISYEWNGHMKQMVERA